ncbi:DUF6886 family protein [Nocardia sp. NPDC049526]|uniref:DUF6886 family protein n=1 Tax=Nocardia sp. NPDC049526 TaxID=3364316 RepID=UPI0037AEFF9C
MVGRKTPPRATEVYPEPGQVLHFSEDPTIERFVPRIAATAQAYVWAVDARNAANRIDQTL